MASGDVSQSCLKRRLCVQEQKYWHSHVYEVQSGMLYTPEGPTTVDMPHMKHLINTYGKTWHTWQVDKDPLPLGTASTAMFVTVLQLKTVNSNKSEQEMPVLCQ